MNFHTSLKHFVAFLLLLCGLYLVPIGIFENNFSMIPGDMGDARLNNYILEHGHLFLTNQIANFWDAPFFYPLKNTIAGSENLLGTMPVYSLLRIIGYDRETSFQLWILLMFALNFICSYWVFHRLSGDTILSAIGAYIFTFSIFILGNITNVQVLPRFMIPLVIYWTWLYLTNHQLKYFLLMCLGTVFQFYCCMYMGFFTVYILLFFIISYLIIFKDDILFLQFRNFSIARDHLLVVITTAIFLLPLALPYFEIYEQSGYRTFKEVESSIPTIRSYFFSSKASLTWNILSTHALSKVEIWWYHELFMGAIPWLGILMLPVVLVSQKVSGSSKQFLQFISLSLFLCFIFCLNINGYTLYYLIYHLPGFGSLRSMNRIMNVEILFFSLIFIFVMIELKKIYPGIRYIVYALPILIVIDNLIKPENTSRFDKKESQEYIREIKETINIQLQNSSLPIAIITVKSINNEIKHNLDVMLASQELGIACVNGYSGSIPDSLVEFYMKGNESGLNKWCHFVNIPNTSILRIYDFDSGVKKIHTVKLKASNNKFVSADHSKGNILIANREHGYAWETFRLILYEDNMSALVSDNDLFVCTEVMSHQELTATKNKISEGERFNIEWLNTNEIALKASNEKYITLDNATMQLFAWSDTIGVNEKFVVITEE